MDQLTTQACFSPLQRGYWFVCTSSGASLAFILDSRRENHRHVYLTAREDRISPVVVVRCDEMVWKSTVPEDKLLFTNITLARFSFEGGF